VLDIGKVYQKWKNYIFTTLIIGPAALAGVTLNPVPITTKWGDIAARDMAAKVEVVEDIKRNLKQYSEDGKWDSKELSYLVAETTPRRFIYHRISDMRPMWGTSYFEALHPKSSLEDQLWVEYNRLFSDGTKSREKGEFASYAEIKKELAHELYNLFINKDKISYEEWSKSSPHSMVLLGVMDSRRKDETEEKWILRHFNGNIDITQTSLSERLKFELDKIAAYFPSEENQRAFKQSTDSLGNFHNRTYNGILFVLAGLFGTFTALDYSEKKRRQRDVLKAEWAKVYTTLEDMEKRKHTPFEVIMSNMHKKINRAKQKTG